MKRLIAILTAMILLTGFTYNNRRPEKYATFGSYIYNLVKTSEIQINFFRAPKVSEYFGDIKDSDYYAGAFINAAVSGILKFPQKRVNPWKWIKVTDAKQLMDKAYMYKTNQKIMISKVVFSELIKMDKYKKVKDNYYLTSQMEKDVFEIYSKKIAEYNKGKNSQADTSDKVNVSKKVENDYLLITMDWGKKPTAGYELKIAGAREVGDSIEVYYTTTSPLPGQMTAQVFSYPKDIIRLSVSNINKAYNIVVKKVDGNQINDVKYFSQIIDNNLKLTLSIGEKPTGGYEIKILEAKQVDNTIEVKYATKSPAPGDMVIQVLTYPMDSIKVKVDDVSKEYKVVLIN